METVVRFTTRYLLEFERLKTKMWQLVIDFNLIETESVMIILGNKNKFRVSRLIIRRESFGA